MKRINRRGFLAVSGASAAAALTGCATGAPRKTVQAATINHACIGVGGMMGSNDLKNFLSHPRARIAAICDVDANHLKKAAELVPEARRYTDWREMLAKEGDQIDSVNATVPDHMHLPIALAAMRAGKHVYCQKPLCHDVFEVRMLTHAARTYNVQTQMGIQIHAETAVKRAVELVNSGVIGKVRQVDIFSDKNWGGGEKPTDTPPVPQTLDWDLWLGPAATRPYHPTYLPGNWRRWWDFGTGTLGDMGCHIIDPVWWALDLTYPTSIEATPGPFNDQTYPQATVVKWEFPARGDLPPVTVTWCDGANRPDRPVELEEGRNLPGQGGLYYGDKGVILAPHMSSPRLIPDAKMKEIDAPEPFLERGVNHYQDWIRACKGGPKPSANFDYSGPLSEAILLGNVAAKAGAKIEWDAAGMTITNNDQANAWLLRKYRDGWTL